jgi:hypothetical protein
MVDGMVELLEGVVARDAEYPINPDLGEPIEQVVAGGVSVELHRGEPSTKQYGTNQHCSRRAQRASM